MGPLELYLEEYRQVHEEVRLYMRRSYWVIFYYPAMIAGIAAVVSYIDPALLQSLTDVSSMTGFLAREGAALLLALLLLPVLSGAIQFFGLYWLFRELRATAYLAWLSKKLRLLAGVNGESMPLWHELSYTNKLSATVELLDKTNSSSIRVARATETVRMLLLILIVGLPMVISCAVIVGYCITTDLHTPIRWVIIAIGMAALAAALVYAWQYKKLNEWLSKHAFKHDATTTGREAKMEGATVVRPSGGRLQDEP